MSIAHACQPGSRRRAFTLQELLVAMALILFILVILSQAFVEGLQAYRNLKAVGDLNERLRTASAQLHRDLQEAHFQATRFIAESYFNGKANPEEAAALRARYEAIAVDAALLKPEFQALLRRTTHPVARRVLRVIIETLGGIEAQSKNMVLVIREIEGGGSPPKD